MKTKSISIFLSMLIFTALSVSLFSCKSDDDDTIERPKTIDTWTFHYFKQPSTFLVGNEGKYYESFVVWNAKQTRFNIFFVQDGKITVGGTVGSNETNPTEEQRRSINLTYNVDVPPSLRRESKFDYNVIAFSINVDFTLTNGNIVCNADLFRNNSSKIWDVGYLTKNGSDVTYNTYSRNLYTDEAVYIQNNTNDTIRVIHKGFDAKEKWYYSKATVSLTPSLQAVPKGISEGEEALSDIVKIAPHESGVIYSHYIPTGKRMNDARLVLEINGKEVKTAPESSNIDVQYGKSYAMAVKWDGINLDWIYDVDNDLN